MSKENPPEVPPVVDAEPVVSDPHGYSLSEVHRSIKVPHGGSFLRMIMAFTGPGLLVAVGYMDPGNWATDLAGGAQFGYTLLSVIMISNLMAIVLQALALKLGVVTGRDLAQACRDQFSKPVGFVLWILAEIAISATDLAEVVGSAVAIQLLFGLPLMVGVLITALDVVLVLFLNSKGFRYIEAVVGALIAVISVCFILELIFARPEWGGVLLGFIPAHRDCHQPRHAVYRHRHPGRDRHAPQPLPALVDYPDPQVRPDLRGQARRDPLWHD